MMRSVAGTGPPRIADPAADWITGQIISVDGGLGFS
jgi:NAD(P)-dependent dehydrogenase (short-subunit alcohol dehydrogenase family)